MDGVQLFFACSAFPPFDDGEDDVLPDGSKMMEDILTKMGEAGGGQVLRIAAEKAADVRAKATAAELLVKKIAAFGFAVAVGVGALIALWVSARDDNNNDDDKSGDWKIENYGTRSGNDWEQLTFRQRDLDFTSSRQESSKFSCEFK